MLGFRPMNTMRTSGSFARTRAHEPFSASTTTCSETLPAADVIVAGVDHDETRLDTE